jgi:hypothetical protein
MFTEVIPGASIMAYYAAESKRLSAANDQDEKPDVRPWRGAEVELGTDQLDNDLTELYEETVRNLTPRAVRECFICHEIVESGNRVTDGEHVWHPGCFSMRLAG